MRGQAWGDGRLLAKCDFLVKEWIKKEEWKNMVSSGSGFSDGT